MKNAKQVRINHKYRVFNPLIINLWFSTKGKNIPQLTLFTFRLPDFTIRLLLFTSRLLLCSQKVPLITTKSATY